MLECKDRFKNFLRKLRLVPDASIYVGCICTCMHFMLSQNETSLLHGKCRSGWVVWCGLFEYLNWLITNFLKLLAKKQFETSFACTCMI